MDIGFLNGIYYIKIELMLSEDDFNALKRLDKALFFKYLKTKNYGYKSKYGFLEEIVVQEVINVKEELKTLMQDSFLANVMYSTHDVANIKMVYKSIKYKIPMATYDRVGSLSIESLVQFFKHGNDRLIPDEFKPLFENISKIEASNTQIFLQEIEKNVYDFYEARAKERKIYKPLYDYIQFQKVIRNLKTLLKLKTRGDSVESFKNRILDEKIIGRIAWVDLFECSPGDLMDRLYILFDEKVVESVEDFIATGDPKYLNEVLKNYLIEKMKAFNNEFETVGPIIYYLYLKEVEIMKVRALYYGK